MTQIDIHNAVEVQSWLDVEVGAIAKKLKVSRGLNSYGVLLPLNQLRTLLEGRGKDVSKASSTVDPSHSNKISEPIGGRFATELLQGLTTAPTQWRFILETGLSQIGDSRVPQAACQIATELFTEVEATLWAVKTYFESSCQLQNAENKYEWDKTKCEIEKYIQSCCAIYEIFFGAPVETNQTRSDLLQDPLLKRIAGGADCSSGDEDGDELPVQLFSELLHDYSEDILLGALSTAAAMTQSLGVLEELLRLVVPVFESEVIKKATETLLYSLSEIKKNNIVSQVVSLLTLRSESIIKGKTVKKTEGDDEVVGKDSLEKDGQPKGAPVTQRHGPLSGFQFLLKDDGDEDEDTYGVLLVHPPTGAGGTASRPPSGFNGGRPSTTSSSRPASSAGPKRVVISSYGEKAAQIIALCLQVVAWGQQRALFYLNQRIHHPDGEQKCNHHLTLALEVAASLTNAAQMVKLRDALVSLLGHCVGLQSAATRNLVSSTSAASKKLSAAKQRALNAATYTPAALTFTAKLVIPILFVIRYMIAVHRQQIELDTLLGPVSSVDPTAANATTACSFRGPSVTPANIIRWLSELLEDSLLPLLNRYCMQLLMVVKGTGDAMLVEEETTGGGLGGASKSILRSRKHQVLLLLHTAEQLCVTVDEVLECGTHLAENPKIRSKSRPPSGGAEQFFTKEYMMVLLRKLLNLQAAPSQQANVSEEPKLADKTAGSSRLSATRNVRPFTPPSAALNSATNNSLSNTSTGRTSPTPSSPTSAPQTHFILSFMGLEGALAGIPEEISMIPKGENKSETLLNVDLSAVVLGRFLFKVSYCIWSLIVFPILSARTNDSTDSGTDTSMVVALSDTLRDAIRCATVRCNFMADFVLTRPSQQELMESLSHMMVSPQDLLRAHMLWIFGENLPFFSTKCDDRIDFHAKTKSSESDQIMQVLAGACDGIIGLVSRQSRIYQRLSADAGVYVLGAPFESASPPNPNGQRLVDLLFAFTHYIGDVGLVFFKQVFGVHLDNSSSDLANISVLEKVVSLAPAKDTSTDEKALWAPATLMQKIIESCGSCPGAVFFSLLQMCEESVEEDGTPESSAAAASSSESTKDIDTLTTIHQQANAELILELMILCNGHCIQFLSQLLARSLEEPHASDNESDQALGATTSSMGTLGTVQVSRPPRMDHFALSPESRSSSANKVTTRSTVLTPRALELMQTTHTSSTVSPLMPPHAVNFKPITLKTILTSLCDPDDVHDLHIVIIPLLNALLQLSPLILVPTSTRKEGTSEWWTLAAKCVLKVVNNTSDLPLKVVSLHTLYNLLNATTNKTLSGNDISVARAVAVAISSPPADDHHPLEVWSLLANLLDSALQLSLSEDIEVHQLLEISNAVCLLAERIVLLLRTPHSGWDETRYSSSSPINESFLQCLSKLVSAIIKYPELLTHSPPRAVTFLLLLLEEDSEWEAIKEKVPIVLETMRSLADLGGTDSVPTPPPDGVGIALPASYVRQQSQIQETISIGGSPGIAQQWVYVRCQALKYCMD